MFRFAAFPVGLALLTTALFLAPGTALADDISQDDFGDSDFDSAFEELDADVPESDTSEDKEEFVDITGTVGFESSYAWDSRAPEIHSPPNGTADWQGFTKARLDGRLQADFYLPKDWKARVTGSAFYDRIYAIHGRTDYTPEVMDEQEIEYEFADTYLQGSLTSKLDLKTGRQVVNWVYADSFRVLDILNPLNNREPGLVDIEDLRLPVTMTVLETFYGDWTLSGIAVHEWREPKNPARGSEFFPIFGPPISDEEPDQWDVFNESAFSLTGTIKGIDLNFRYASVYDDSPRLDVSFPGGMLAPPLLQLEYNKIDMYGMGAQGTVGAWLVKAEAAYRDDLTYSTDGQESIGRLDTLIGIEYYGFPNNQTLSLEVVHQHHHDWDSIYFSFPTVKQRNNTNGALRYTSNYLNERLELTALAVLFGQWDDDSLQRGGGLYRLSLDYEVNDSINLIGTGVLYQGGVDPFLDAIQYNDRVSVRIEYNF